MLIFIDPSGNYPRFPGDITLDNPLWSVGDPLPEGWTPVQSVAPPEADASQILTEEYPEILDGAYTQKWTLRSKTSEELALDVAAQTARQKLKDLGLTDIEIDSLARGLK
jgi:hypothetical protein